MFGITCAPRLRRVRSNNGYLSLRTAVSHPFFNLSIKTDHHPSPSFPSLRTIRTRSKLLSIFKNFYSGDPTDKIPPFFFSPPPWKVWNRTVRNEEKFATISYEADSRDTKGARKSLRFRPEDIFSTLSGDGVSSYRPRLHLDSRLLVL